MFTQQLRSELKRTLAVALPLIGAQILQVSNGLVDTLVAGRIGSEELAASGLGAAMWFIGLIACIGLLAGLSPSIAKLLGERRRSEVGELTRQGLWLALALGVTVTAALLVLAQVLHLTPLDPRLAARVPEYLVPAAFSLPAAAIVIAARNVCEADGRTGVMLWAQAIGLGINIVADLGLGLGWFGLPELGLAGIGWATTAVQWSMAAVLLWWIAGPRMAKYGVFARYSPPDRQAIGALLSLSLPIYLALLFEAGLFSATAMQAGALGVLPMGAHNIAIGATSFAYMLPLGLSLALTARVGRVHGRGFGPAVRLRAVAGFLLTCVLAGFTALLLWAFRDPIAALYTPDPALRALAAQLLVLAAVFQLSDGMQATMFGILRGLHDTRAPMLINAFSYWCVAFGLGFWLAHGVGLGVAGLWYGLIIGLTISSIGLGLRVIWQIRHYDRLRRPAV